VHFNHFEPRPYAPPYEESPYQSHFEKDAGPGDQLKLMPRALRIPGTQEQIKLAPRARRNPPRNTPARRHGVEAFVRRKNGKKDTPDLYRILYRPWLYAGTKVGAKLDRSWAHRAASQPRDSGGKHEDRSPVQDKRAA
jgi:hypothetical protein